MTDTAEALWKSALERIGSGVLSPGAKPWIAGTRAVRISGDTMVLAVPSAFAKQWLEDHYAGALADALGQSAGRPLGLEVTIDSQRGEPDVVVIDAPAESPPEPAKRSAISSPLNPKYTFDSFVIGPSNRFAARGCAGRGRAARRGSTTRCSSTAAPASARRTCCTRSGTTSAGSTRRAVVRYVSSRAVHERVHPGRPRGEDAASSGSATAKPTCSSSTTSSSSREESRRRKSSSTRSTRFTPTDVRSSSPPTARPSQIADARGAAPHALRVGPRHRRPAARSRDARRDPAEEGRAPRASDVADDVARVHRAARAEQHPRARGEARPRRRVRVADSTPP